MKLVFNRGNSYFDTYYIMDENGNKVGIVEVHERMVTENYYVGWRLTEPNSDRGNTDSFATIEEAMIYSVGCVVER